MILYCDVHTHRENAGAGILSIRSYEADPLLVLPGDYCSVGVHPYSNPEEWTAHLEILNRLVVDPSVVAIGEAGLDKRSPASLERQEDLFVSQAQLAESYGKPLVIHCVKAWNELGQIKKRFDPRVPWVIHGFRGNGSLAEQMRRAGFILSFGFYFHPEAVRRAWPEGLLTETDERKEGIQEVYMRLSAVLDLPVEPFARQIRENVQSYFSI